MHDQQPTPPETLLGSTAADIVAGIVAAIVWWGVSVAAIASNGPLSGLITLAIVCVFLTQLVFVGACVPGAKKFVITQIIAALILPLIAIGLFFGACLLKL